MYTEFLTNRIANRARISHTLDQDIATTVATTSKLYATRLYKGIDIIIQGAGADYHRFILFTYIRCVVLGAEWLSTLRPIEWDFSDKRCNSNIRR